MDHRCLLPLYSGWYGRGEEETARMRYYSALMTGRGRSIDIGVIFMAASEA